MNRPFLRASYRVTLTILKGAGSWLSRGIIWLSDLGSVRLSDVKPDQEVSVIFSHSQA